MKDEMTKTYDILCVGACVQDILIDGMSRESFDQPVTILREAVFTSGGDATNEAVVLSRLGSRTVLAARVDGGAVGDFLCADLRKEGVGTDCLVRDADSRSTSAFVVLGDEGEHTFFLAKGENEGISLEEMDLSVLQETRAVCIGSLYTSYRLDRGGAEELMRLAKEAGVLTFADMDHDVEGLGPEAMDSVYPYLDYLIPGISEAQYVTGRESAPEAAEVLLKKGVGTVVIKLGSQGCYVKNATEEFYMDPYEVEPKDTTGCGDNFVAGFIHSILEGKSLYDSAKFACAVGAVNSQATGGHRAVRSREQIEAFMRMAAQREIIRE